MESWKKRSPTELPNLLARNPWNFFDIVFTSIRFKLIRLVIKQAETMPQSHHVISAEWRCKSVVLSISLKLQSTTVWNEEHYIKLLDFSPTSL